MVSAYEGCGRSVRHKQGLIEEYLVCMGMSYSTADVPELATATAGVREEYMGALFIRKSDRTRFGRLLEELQNNFVMGPDNYPNTLTEGLSILQNCCHNPSLTRVYSNASNQSVAYVAQGGSDDEEQDEEQNGTEGTALVAGGNKGGTDNKTGGASSGGRRKGGKKEPPWLKDVECYHCGEMGHTNKFCPMFLAEQKRVTHHRREWHKLHTQKTTETVPVISCLSHTHVCASCNPRVTQKNWKKQGVSQQEVEGASEIKQGQEAQD